MAHAKHFSRLVGALTATRGRAHEYRASAWVGRRATQPRPEPSATRRAGVSGECRAVERGVRAGRQTSRPGHAASDVIRGMAPYILRIANCPILRRGRSQPPARQSKRSLDPIRGFPAGGRLMQSLVEDSQAH